MSTKLVAELQLGIDTSDNHVQQRLAKNTLKDDLQSLHILLSRIILIDSSAVDRIVEPAKLSNDILSVNESEDEDESPIVEVHDSETKMMLALGLPANFTAHDCGTRQTDTEWRKSRKNKSTQCVVNQKHGSNLLESADFEIQSTETALTTCSDDQNDEYWLTMKASFSRAYADLQYRMNNLFNSVIKRSSDQSKRNLSFGDLVWWSFGSFLSSATWLSMYGAWMTAEDRKAQTEQLELDCVALRLSLSNLTPNNESLIDPPEDSQPITDNDADYWNAVWRRHRECVRTCCLSLTDTGTGAEHGESVKSCFQEKSEEVSQLDGANDCDGADNPDSNCATVSAPKVTQAHEEVAETAQSVVATGVTLSAAEKRRRRVAKSAALWTNVANASATTAARATSSNASHSSALSFEQVLQTLYVPPDVPAPTLASSSEKSDSAATVVATEVAERTVNTQRVKSTLHQLGFVWNDPKETENDSNSKDLEFYALLNNARSFKCRSKQLAKARKLGLASTASASATSAGSRQNDRGEEAGEVGKKQGTEKYVAQKYRLFSRFDRGIQVDDESWWSVTPEQIARHHAERCACDVIVDACCGVGGNAIQFARTCSRVLAFDINSTRLEMARHNSLVYDDSVDKQYSGRIELLRCDFAQFVKSSRVGAVDVVFLDLPWGGPQYLQNTVYDIDAMQLETNENGQKVQMSVTDLFRIVAERLTCNIAVFAPRNCDMQQLVSLARFTDGRVELEQNLLNRKLKTITAYFGSLVKN